jgi:hypothetical protein
LQVGTQAEDLEDDLDDLEGGSQAVRTAEEASASQVPRHLVPSAQPDTQQAGPSGTQATRSPVFGTRRRGGGRAGAAAVGLSASLQQLLGRTEMAIDRTGTQVNTPLLYYTLFIINDILHQ